MGSWDFLYKWRWKRGNDMKHSDGWFGGGIPILSREETIDEYLENIKYNLLQKESRINSLQDSIKKITDEKYASEEMQKMKNQLEEARADLHRGFSITEGENDLIYNWKREHETTRHMNPKGYHGVSGGGYVYKFYPTAIGTSGVCQCTSCYRKAIVEACKEGVYNVDIFNKCMKEWGGEIEFQELY